MYQTGGKKENQMRQNKGKTLKYTQWDIATQNRNKGWILVNKEPCLQIHQCDNQSFEDL